MKKLKRFAFILLIALMPLGYVGCGTAPVDAAYKVERTAAITVETALKAWNDWIPVGHPTVAQERVVKDAYLKYQKAQVTLIDAAIAYSNSNSAPDGEKLSTAISESGKTLTDIIALIRQFGANI